MVLLKQDQENIDYSLIYKHLFGISLNRSYRSLILISLRFIYIDLHLTCTLYYSMRYFKLVKPIFHRLFYLTAGTAEKVDIWITNRFNLLKLNLSGIEIRKFHVSIHRFIHIWKSAWEKVKTSNKVTGYQGYTLSNLQESHQTIQ